MNLGTQSASLSELDTRARVVFKSIVDSYLQHGTPVGSRTLAKKTGDRLGLSPASIRNTMADLAAMGLLTAPHTSAGRMPTHRGLRLFVDGLMEIDNLSRADRQSISKSVSRQSTHMDDVLENASKALSEIASGAGIVLAPALKGAFRHVEFIALDDRKALMILVYEDGHIENRILDIPLGMVPSALERASNFLSNRLAGKRLSEVKVDILREIESGRAALDSAAGDLVKQGIASWSGHDEDTQRNLIVRGRAQLLDKSDVQTDLERIQLLFEDLERKQELIALLDEAEDAEGVKIFIGAENPLFSLSGSSVVVAPYRDQNQNVIGALGVIGPTRINYARVIPMVDYTADIIGRVLSKDT